MFVDEDGLCDEQQREEEWNDKEDRHEIFAEWLVKTYGIAVMSTGSGVLDVAGGNGKLSLSLSKEGIPTILVDPQPRWKSDELETIELPLHGDGSCLTNRTDRVGSLIRNCALIAGMHPDQATEPIIDLAVRLGVSFAVLPCCVMPSLFPQRRRRAGEPVRSYSAFCQYLLEKAPNGMEFEVDYLPFLGRNKVIYWKKSSQEIKSVPYNCSLDSV